MSDRILRVMVLIQREDGKEVGWVLGQPGYITAVANEQGRYDRSSGEMTNQFSLTLRSDGPVQRILPEEPAIESSSTLEGEVVP